LDGPHERFTDARTVTKSKEDRTLWTHCEVWSHQFGYELKLMIDGHGLHMSAVCRSRREMTERADAWRAAMAEKGWTE
jgi:hypothetical protein